MPFLEVFDAADACDCYRRTTSVVPQQALAMVNNELTLALAHRLADRLWAEVGVSLSADRDRERDPGPEAAFVTAAFEQVLARPPSAGESALAAEFLDRQARLLGGARWAPSSAPGGAAVLDPQAQARADLVHALFSHHDFVTIH